ncbi:MAG: DMT family transporter [Bacteroidetes bacterium]|nr:DMT family transporter [Bacteroidota bacterium]
MFYLTLVILTSTSILVLFKLFPKYDIHILQAIVVNYITAAVLGFAIQWNSFSVDTVIHEDWFVYAIVIGCIFILTFQVFAYSSQTVGVAITAISSKISVVIPVFMGAFLYVNESLSFLKILGLVFAIISFLLVFNNNANFKINPRFIFLPVLLFVVNGLNDAMQTYVQRKFDGFNSMLFVSCIFFFSLLVGVIWLIINYFRLKQKLLGRNIIAGILLGILNFVSTFYFFKGVAVVESAVFFPVLNTGVVSLSAITGFFVFKEKFNLINWIGILVAIGTIIFIAWI